MKKLLFLTALLQFLITPSSAQRRLVSHCDGSVMSMGGVHAYGSKNSSSKAGYLLISFKEGIEFSIVGGTLKSDEKEVSYFSPEIEMYSASGRLHPFVDFAFLKWKRAKFAMPQAINFSGGMSVDITEGNDFRLAPELGYGVVMILSGERSAKPQTGVFLGISSAKQLTSKASLVFSVSANQLKNLWSGSISIGLLFSADTPIITP